jgi:hypothetical protein
VAFLAPGLAKAYYDRILEIHFNRGSQGYEQKVVEYKDLMDKMMDNIQGVDRKTGSQLNGYDFVSSEVRGSKNHQGTVSPILWYGLLIIRSFRNEIVHRKIRIDYDDYRMCVKFLAKAIESFSQVPILNEIVDIYSKGSFPNPVPNAPPVPNGNKPRPTEAVPEGLLYQKTFKGVVITGYTGNETSLVIPSLIEGKEVIGISPRAFIKNTILQRISFPETLETIGDNAFNGCYALQQINFPENLKSIGGYAFYSCRLNTVSLPEKIEGIDSNVFSSCAYLHSIYLSRRTKITGFFSNVKLIYLD